MTDYTHWDCFRRVWKFTFGENWRAAAEARYGLETSTLEEVINVPAEEDIVRKMKADLLAELDAHKAYLRSLIANAEAMEREVAYDMDDAACAAASRHLAFEPHELFVREILMEGEFACETDQAPPPEDAQGSAGDPVDLLARSSKSGDRLAR